MSKMEGFLMKKGWFNNWKMRFVTCSDQVLVIYKAKEDEKSGHAYNVINCDVKRIDPKRWNRDFVFRLKFGKKRIYLAAEDENSLTQWTNSIRDRVKRASLLGATAPRCINSNSKRPSMSSLSRSDYGLVFEFRIAKYEESLFNISKKKNDPEALYKFAEVCGNFLGLVHAKSKELFDSDKIDNVDGLNIETVSFEKRNAYLKRMKINNFLQTKDMENVFFPLQCMIDYGGKSLFFESKIEGNENLSQENITLLESLGLDL